MATTKNKKLCPCPELGAGDIGGIVSGAGSVIGAGIQALTTPSLRNQRKSKQKYDKWYQENITEKNMALENQYQIEAENRANAYNDPSAVAARMKDAGISPAAALGGSASGAGIMSQSDAPSAGGTGGFSPSPMAVRADFSGLGDIVQSALGSSERQAKVENIRADTMAKLMQAGVSEQQAKSIAYDLENMKPEEVRSIKLKNANQEIQNQAAQIDYMVKAATMVTDIATKKQLLENAKQELENLKQNEKFMKSNAAYFDARTNEINEMLEVNKENVKANTRKANAEAQTFEDTLELKKDQITADITNILMELGIKENQLPKIRYETWRYINNLPTGDLNAWDIPWAILNGVASAANGFGSDIGVPDIEDKMSKNRERLLKSLRKKYNYKE